MFEAVGNVGSGVSSAPRAVAAATTTAPASQGGAENGVVQVAPLSPRMTVDPTAGVLIMEYLTDSGDKTAQLPSETVVAYLRSGLSADGTPFKDEQASIQTEV
ncbi:MAG: hypothetical protein PHD48_00325 [Alphaproteobacteria bacterium]|nr:hypothetical protein [Alphaproteobacteria bacterium]